MLCLPENIKIVEGLAPQVGAAATVTSDYISVKNMHKLYAVIHYNQGDADNQTWAVYRATAVAPTGSVVVANVCRIWSNLDCATSDTLVARTAAINYASGAGATHKQVVFEIDPAELGDTYDVVAVGSAGNIAATSYVSIMFYCVPRYTGRVSMQPTVITN